MRALGNALSRKTSTHATTYRSVQQWCSAIVLDTSKRHRGAVHSNKNPSGKKQTATDSKKRSSSAKGAALSVETLPHAQGC